MRLEPRVLESARGVLSCRLPIHAGGEAIFVNMNSNTTPEARVNKLGHVVTKHVLKQKPESTSKSPLPAPVLKTPQPSSPDLSDFVSHVTDENNYVHVVYKRDIMGDLTGRLAHLSDDTKRIIAQADKWDSEENNNNRVAFAFLTIIHKDEQTIRETLAHMPSLSNSTDSGFTLAFIKGLHQLDYFKDHQGIEALDPHDHHVARAFLKVTEAVYDFAGGTDIQYEYDDGAAEDSGHFINNKALADLISENPDKADQLVEFLQEREEVDVDAMREYVAAGPLRDGVI